VRLVPDLVLTPQGWERGRAVAITDGRVAAVQAVGASQRGDVALPGRVDRNASAPESAATLSDASVASDRASVLVEAAAAGHLLFSRTFFPAWKARVDGTPAPVSIANGRDLAVAVPPGRHRVDFEYDRSPFVCGVVLQVLVFFLLLAIAVRK